jgi:hypothetical protein
MSPFPTCFDASINGAIASATLAAASPCAAPEYAPIGVAVCKSTVAAAPTPARRARSGWQRGFDALVSLVDGPTREAGNIRAGAV